MTLTDAEIEQFIRDSFEQNFELLSLQSGHSLSAHVKDTALNQAIFYWRKLKSIATKVTETEVRLNLPNQKTPHGRQFGIEGVVDIVRADDQTVMYDVKTHDSDSVRESPESYEHQLNIYAYIWHHLRGQQLDQTAIIATAYPDAVKEALASRNDARLDRELERWNPVVEITFDPEHVEHIIQEFGQVVDCIEESQFEPASLEKLHTRSGREQREFASHVCRYCDVRFSCDSYRQYARVSSGRAELALRQYLEDFGTDLDQQDWLSSTLEAALALEELE